MSAGAAKEDFISSKYIDYFYFISLLDSWINVEAFIVISKAGPISIISDRLTFEIPYLLLIFDNFFKNTVKFQFWPEKSSYKVQFFFLRFWFLSKCTCRSLHFCCGIPCNFSSHTGVLLRLVALDVSEHGLFILELNELMMTNLFITNLGYNWTELYSNCTWQLEQAFMMYWVPLWRMICPELDFLWTVDSWKNIFFNPW